MAALPHSQPCTKSLPQGKSPLLERKKKQSPPGKAPAPCAGLVGASPALPDLCQTAGSLLPLCRAHPVYFSFPAAVLMCTQTPLIFYVKGFSMDQTMATQQIPISPPWYLFLEKPSKSGVWLRGNVVLVAPILLLVHYHPSAETTSWLSHVFTIPVL